MAGELQTDYGDFAADFAVECLSNLCEADGGVQTGPFGSQLHQEDYVAVGTPIITVEHLGENRIEHSDVPCVSDEDRNRLSKYQLRKGDIVFSRVGSVDRRALVRGAEDGWLFSGRCLRVRPDKSKIDPEFLSYFFGLPSFKEYIRAIAVGATMPSLNTQILSDVVVAHPKDVNEQRAIARVLSTLGDKIELNCRMNETLEAMARAIFKSWFVHFDPVRVKAEGRDPWLPKHIADLFPDHFEESEVGEIPAGWEVTRWGALVSLEYGKSLTGYAGENGMYPVYGTNGRIGSHSKPLCNHPGIIIGRKGAYRGVHYCSTPFYVIDTAFYVEAKIGTELRWAYYELLRQDINDMDSGSAIPSTSREDFYSLPVLSPPVGVQAAFAKYLSPFWSRQELNISESRTLAALRDTLLPRLISGELRIKDAKTVLETRI